tara:strand:+ start:115 stop:627 length:513 start_codon:yes stop_codon:yes gene_type:complete
LSADSDKNPEPPEEITVPDGALEFRQSHFAWIMPSAFWVILLFVLSQFDFLTMGILPFILAPVIAAPRYLRWKNTVYSLSTDSLFLTTAGIPILQKSRTYKVSFDTMAQMEVKHGMFGRTLGYGEINIIFDDRRLAKLSYIQNYTEFTEHIENYADLPGISEESDENHQD